MKLSNAVILMAVSGGHAAVTTGKLRGARRTNANVVPQPTLCPTFYHPVVCGGEQVFQNLCFAAQAGYSADNCVPEEDNAACPKILQPVICGDEHFMNQCFANLAGFSDQECHEDNDILCTPPTLMPQEACGDVYDPVVCGPEQEAFFTNLCLASAAGYDEGDCVPQFECCDVYDPVRCGDAIFDSMCAALQSGNKAEDCQLIRDSAANGESIAYELRASKSPIESDSPAAAPSISGCPTVYDPVLCGGFEILYTNQCEASKAGFKPEDCSRPSVEDCDSPIEDPTAPPSILACPAVYDPVVCGGSQIPYTNQCEASLDGFMPEDCSRPGVDDCDIGRGEAKATPAP